MSDIPVLITQNALARRAGAHRSVIDRLQRQAGLAPDAYLDVGDGALKQPVFRPEKVVFVLRAMSARPRRAARHFEGPAQSPIVAQ